MRFFVGGIVALGGLDLPKAFLSSVRGLELLDSRKLINIFLLTFYEIVIDSTNDLV